MSSKAQIPQGWRQVRLGDVAEVDTGGTPNRSRPEYWDGQIPWMASGQINQRRVMTTVEGITWEGLKNSNAKLFPSGTVMVAMNGQGATRGKACVLGIEASCNQSLAAICSRQQTENGFLFHVLDSAYHLLRSLTGDGRAGLNLELIRGFSFLLPLLPEQRAIAAVLDSIDDAIECTDAVIAATEQLRGSLLHQLLTRGIPGWHTEWKEAPGLGTIPAGWEVVRLGEVAMVRNGTTPSRKNMDYWDSGCIPFVKTGRVNDIFIQEPDEFITPKAVTDSGVVVIPEGSVLIAMIGQGKTRGMTAKLGFRAAINQNFAAVFEPRQGFTLDFFFAWASHNYALIRSLGQGSNQDALNCELIQRMLIPFPSKPEQRAITRPLAGVDAALARARYEEKCLQGLKDSTADAVLTGRVRVHQPK